MSGGSLNYLYLWMEDITAEPSTNDRTRVEDLQRVIDYLRLGTWPECTVEFERLIHLLKRAQTLASELADVAKAVEWQLSNDGYQGQIRDAVARWNLAYTEVPAL